MWVTFSIRELGLLWNTADDGKLNKKVYGDVIDSAERVKSILSQYTERNIMEKLDT